MTSFFYWIVLGLIAGWAGSKIVNKTGEGLIMDIVVGVIGAVVGGFLASLVGIHAEGSFLLNLFVAIIGSIIVLLVYRKVAVKA
jgi:uncharacterized membrane protein YeaQ/YmgE (transglycosylase-associated protein family)